MATFTTQRYASGYIPVTTGFNDTGVFTIGFPVTADQNIPNPYNPSVGDVILLGWIPKGFTVYQGWIDAGMSTGGATSWFFGDGSGPSNRISYSGDITISGLASRYYFLINQPSVFYGNNIIPDLTLVAQVPFTMTCNTDLPPGTATLTSAAVYLRGSMDFANSTLTPAGGGLAPGMPMGVYNSGS